MSIGSLVNIKQNAATCWPLYPTYARTKDDRQLIYIDEVLHRVGLELIRKINTNFRKAF